MHSRRRADEEQPEDCQCVKSLSDRRVGRERSLKEPNEDEEYQKTRAEEQSGINPWGAPEQTPRGERDGGRDTQICGQECVEPGPGIGACGRREQPEPHREPMSNQVGGRGEEQARNPPALGIGGVRLVGG